MASRIGENSIDCSDPESAAGCRCAALGHRITDRDEILGARPVDIGQGDVSWVVMEDPAGNVVCLTRTTLPPELEPFHHHDAVRDPASTPQDRQSMTMPLSIGS